MRTIKYIVLHCSATSQNATIDGIQRYWRNVMGWKSPGYHWIIDKQGNTHQLANDEAVTNGVKGYNQESIHISYIGGVDAENRPMDNRTPAQVMAMFTLIYNYKKKFPNAEILGHRDFPNVKKACPSFDVKTWVKATGLNFKNT